ncbi:MAG: ribonuclease P protein component [Gammaproteobacteria bacterium]|nr:ribonuclease P protein component [Gammaproteobacteria bacterium]
MERVRGRSAFARLRADGVRVGHGLLWVRFSPDPFVGAACVAYALPRQVGSAVIRNTIRRRLRAIVGALDQESSGGLPAGLYLIGAKRGAGQLPYADLRFSLQECLSRLERTGP